MNHPDYRSPTSTYDLLEGMLGHVKLLLNGCIVWTGRQNSGGYGQLGNSLVQRTAYRTFVAPIPYKHTITTTCRNRLCLTPTHLIAVPEGTPRPPTVRQPRPPTTQRCGKCGAVGHNVRSCDNQL
jgi:hypothetical protein